MEEVSRFKLKLATIILGALAIILMVIAAYCLFQNGLQGNFIQIIPNVVCILLGLVWMKTAGSRFYNGLSEGDIERMNRRKKDQND